MNKLIKFGCLISIFSSFAIASQSNQPINFILPANQPGITNTINFDNIPGGG